MPSSDRDHGRKRSRTLASGLGILIVLAGGWALSSFFLQQSPQVAGETADGLEQPEPLPIGQVSVLGLLVNDEFELDVLVDSCNGMPEVSLSRNGADGGLEIEAQTSKSWSPIFGCADLATVEIADDLRDSNNLAPIGDVVSGNALFGFEGQLSSLSLRVDTIERLAMFEPDGIWEVSNIAPEEVSGSATTVVGVEIRDGFAKVCTLDESSRCHQEDADGGEVALRTELLRFLANFDRVEVSGTAEAMTWQFKDHVLLLEKV